MILSVVVPALNEAPVIEETLSRLVAQDAVDEVIVVDNGSDDGTPHIVEQFAAAHPKVQLIHEPARGIPAARNAGFDKARGDVIARTDADTLVADDWAATIRDHLAAHPDTAALTGLCTYHDSPIGFFLEFGQRLLLRLGKVGGQVANMYGPNMALRRTAWHQVRPDVQTRADIAEDLDLALCLMTRGLRIHQLPTMRARTSSRRRRTTPHHHWKFHHIGVRTLEHHGLRVPPQHRLIIVGACISHTLQWPIYRFWDFHARRFTLRPGAARISATGATH